jgi:hypothetical protein
VAIRESLPTLTEDDIRAEGERVTIPTPIPAELVRWMMAEAENGAPDPAGLRGPPSAPASRAPASAPREVPGSRLPVSPPRAVAVSTVETVPPRPAAGVGEEEELEITEMPAAEQADVVESLVEEYLTKLGPRAGVPVAVLSAARTTEVQLDHWAGFILSLVDGATTIDEIIAASPMPEHEALRLLAELQQRGVIDVRAPKKPVPPPLETPRILSPAGDDGLTLDDIDSWT